MKLPYKVMSSAALSVVVASIPVIVHAQAGDFYNQTKQLKYSQSDLRSNATLANKLQDEMDNGDTIIKEVTTGQYLDYVKANDAFINIIANGGDTNTALTEAITAGATSATSDELNGYTPATPDEETLAVSSVSAITNTVVDVTLDTAVTTVDKSMFTIKDSTGAVVAVSSASLSTDGKTITLLTAAQTTGASYTLTTGTTSKTFVGGVSDTEAPTAVVATATKNTTVTVTFTDANRLDVASATNVANYSIPGLTITGATVDGKVVTLTTSTQTVGTVYTVSVNGVKDVAGNAITTALTSSFAGKGADTTAPASITSVAYNNTKVVVTFNEDVDPTTATTLANYTIAGLTPTAASFVSTDNDATLYSATKNRSVVLTVPAQTVGTVYTVSVLGVKDTSGNAITTAITSSFAGKAADTTAPTVQSATAFTNTKVVVTFNENLDATSANTAANYTIAGLTPTAASLITTSTDATLYNATANKSVVLTVPAQTAGTVYTVSVLGVKDTSGNAITTASTATFAGKTADTTVPTISSVTTLTGNKVQIVFSEAMDSTSVQTLTNYSISTLGYPVSVDSWTPSTKTLVLNTAAQSNGVVYTLTTTGVKDLAGNAIAASTTNTFAGIGTALDAPALSSVTPLDNSRIKVIFNKPVQNVSILDFDLYKGSGSTTDTLADNTNEAVVKLTDTDYIIYLGDNAADKLVSDIYTLKVKAGDILPSDFGGTSISTTDTTKCQKIFGGVDTAAVAPAITSLTQTDARTLVAKFNQEVTTSNLAAASNVTVTYDNGSGGTTTINLGGTTAATYAYVDPTDKTRVTFKFASDIAGDKVAKLNILPADFVKFNDISGKIPMVKNATTNYEYQFGTQTFTASALALSSVTCVDEQTLELAFNQDITFNLGNALTTPGGGTDNDFLTIVKDSDGSPVTYDLKYAEQTATNKVRVYFTGASNFSEGTIYKLAITDNLEGDSLFKRASDGTELAATTTTAQKTFGYNAAVNAAPYLVSATPLSDNVVQLTFSEPLSTVPTSDGTVATDLTFWNGSTQITAAQVAIANVGTGADTNKIFTATLSGGVFTAGTTYTVKVPSTVTITDKYAVDTIKTDTVAAPTQADVTFGGAATGAVTAPTASDLGFSNGATKQVTSAAGIAQDSKKTLEVYTGTTAPTATTDAEYTYDLTAAPLTANTPEDLAAAGGAATSAGDTVYYRFVDQANSKSAWVADGTVPVALADATLTSASDAGATSGAYTYVDSPNGTEDTLAINGSAFAEDGTVTITGLTTTVNNAAVTTSSGLAATSVGDNTDSATPKTVTIIFKNASGNVSADTTLTLTDN